MKTRLDVLIGARNLLADKTRWTQRASARNCHGETVNPASPGAVQWCVVGALFAQLASDEHMGIPHYFEGIYHKAISALEAATNYPHESAVTFNDTRCHADVLAAFDKAISNLQETT